MKTALGRTVFLSCLLIVLLVNVPSVTAEVKEFQIESTELHVYRDGLIRVAQVLTVNETVPEVSFPVFGGSAVDNLIVVDENQTVLDYEISFGNLTVFSLGATTVSVQYDTSSLTSKEAEVWTILLDTPYNLTVVLPESSSIVFLSGVPNSIDSSGETMELSLFSGLWEISYTFPLNPPANFLVSNLVVSPAEIKPNQEVTVSVTVSNIGGQTGSYTVPLVVNNIQEDTQLVTLNKGESTTVDFKITKNSLGTYNIAVNGLVHSFMVTETPSNNLPSGDSGSFPFEYLIVVVIAVAVVVALFLLRKKGPKTETIFEKNPQLNSEEKDVIEFLADNDGKAFESQIRERFPDIPRTSLWRLVKRLERLEIVAVKKIGLENQVQLKK